MKILSEYNKPIDMTSISDSIGFTHCWYLDARDMDFCLREMTYMEETTGPTMSVLIHNQVVALPASWHILIVDKETYSIDFVPVTALVSFARDLYLFSPHDTKLNTTTCRFVDLEEEGSVVHPQIDKPCALTIPVHAAPSHSKMMNYCIVAGPQELYRYTDNKTVGDLI